MAFEQAKLRQPRRKRSVGTFDIVEDEQSERLKIDLAAASARIQLHKKRVQSQATSRRMAPSARLHSINEAESIRCKAEPITHAQDQSPGDSRRSTIFTPEDTTVMTTHPGHRHDKTFALKSVNVGRRPKKTSEPSLAKSVKKYPLQIDHSVPQVPNFTIDRAGPSTGKENIPPGSTRLRAGNKLEQSKIFNQHTAGMSLPSQAAVSQSLIALPVLLQNVSPSIGPANPTTALASSGSLTMSQQASQSASSRKSGLKRKYPVIDENIGNMMHYEDAWVAHQEVLLTELLNVLFHTFKPKTETPSKDLRRSLLKLYEEQEHDCIMRKVKASLYHGALALPTDESSIQPMASRYVCDLRVRFRFLRLWIDTYKPILLKVALEVITGRKIPKSNAGIRLALLQFIESCLLLNEDLDDNWESSACGVDLHRDTYLWRRTMYRSLGLILLLDKAKNARIISGNLLRNKSTFKTSQSILEEVNNLLRGSSVDAARVLRFIGYKVSYIQSPSSEYDYTIRNIAANFRDGIRLGRLAELLQSPARQIEDDHRTMRRLSSERVWTTANLRFPAITRATQKTNVEKVFTFLNASGHADCIIRGIQVFEIVDGHREQTLALLWNMVGHFGIGLIVDWSDLDSEIERLEGELGGIKTQNSTKITVITPSSDSIAMEHQMLKRWTTLLANKHGFPISNFSTSFSKIPSPFTAIIKEYLPYMTKSGKPPQTVAHSLKDQLKQIGCGPTFSSLFSRSTIFDERFIVLVLILLASRALKASKQNRTRRFALKTLAEHSASVVQTRDETEMAAKVIQKAWRSYLVRREKQAQALQKQQIQETEPDFWLL